MPRGAQQVVTLNCRRILREVELSTGLVVHSEGVEPSPDGKYTGWFILQIPIGSNMSYSCDEMVYGKPSPNEQDAVESASVECIKRIMSAGKLAINDINYDALCDAITDARVASLAARTAKLKATYRDAKASSVSFERDRLLAEKETLLSHLAHACTAFDDVLPIKVLESPAVPSDISTGKLEYTGSMPPVTRLEQLACFLIHNLLGPEYTKIRPQTSMDDLD